MDFSNYDSAINNLSGLGTTYNALSSASGNRASSLSNQANTYLTNYIDKLTSNQATNQKVGELLKGQLGNEGSTYAKAKANLAQDYASRGITNSGAAAGGYSGLESSRAGDITNATANAGEYLNNLQLSNMGTAYNALNNAANNANQTYLSELSSQGNISNQLASDELQKAQLEYQEEQANKNGWLSDLSGLGSALGSSKWKLWG